MYISVNYDTWRAGEAEAGQVARDSRQLIIQQSTKGNGEQKKNLEIQTDTILEAILNFTIQKPIL